MKNDYKKILSDFKNKLHLEYKSKNFHNGLKGPLEANIRL